MTIKGPSLLVLVAIVAAAAGYWLGRPTADGSAPGLTALNEDGRQVKFYQSPMHPWIVSDEPGRCTICGMALVPVYDDASDQTAGDSITLSAASAAVIGVATEPVQLRNLIRTLNVNGVFEIDHTRHRVLSARVPGRIEDLYVDHVGMEVAANDPLVTLYSPAMLTAQRIYVERQVAGPDAFSASQFSEARERLLDLGATEADLQQLDETRQPQATVTLRAPFTGTVVRRGKGAFTGAYVEESDTLFEIGDLTSLWFVFNAYETDLAVLQAGQTVAISAPDQTRGPTTATLSFIDPNLDPVTRTARIRVEVPNPQNRWHHRQTAGAEVSIALGEHLTVPRSAVLFTRDEPIAFVQLADRTFAPRTITLGKSNDDYYVVTDGLDSGDRVVSEAALMIEGQAQLMMPTTLHETKQAMVMATNIDTDIAALQPFVLATADAAEALASDQLSAYIESLPELHQAWQDYLAVKPDAHQGPMDTKVNELVDGPDLTSAREAFEPFSTMVADLARQAGLHHNGLIKIFQCPMSPVLGKGRWVQRGQELRNPFFGSAMLTCGSSIN